MEEWAGAILPLREFFPPGRAHRLGSGESLSLGQHRHAASDLEAAALRLKGAIALGGIGLQFGIDLTDSGDRLLGVTARIGGFVGIAFTHGEVKKD